MNEWQLMSVTPPVGEPIELRVHPEYERINPLVRQWRRVQPAPAAEREPETAAASLILGAKLDMCLVRIGALETRLPPLKDLERRVSNISDTLMSLDDSVQQLEGADNRLTLQMKSVEETSYGRINSMDKALTEHLNSHHDTADAVEHQSEPPQCVRDLLAVIHRDGGDYLADHGLDIACRDAETAVTRLLHRTGRRDLLASAIELREGWQQKALGAQERLAKANAQLDWLCEAIMAVKERATGQGYDADTHVIASGALALPTTRDAISAAMKEESTP